ncbi:MAG: deoxyribodipyrimidine photolyase [Maribacter sp.]|nr:deoxyribodipyrimidine photolyase [Maribacter sp.]
MTALFEDEIKLFPISYEEILQRVRKIDPIAYASTRNYLDGAVTYLSPYISRGVISTRYILAEVLKRGYQPTKIEKFIQELAWRDYWQQIWMTKGNAINADLKNKQQPVSNNALPKAIRDGQTGIEAIDKAIKDFYRTGYLHNHMRMYIASLACNLGQSHWKLPAQWMYYHLLDADWASNALSWQWVAGANSNKKYVADQDNINKYCHTQQQRTFLDVSYDALQEMPIPTALIDVVNPHLKTPLPEKKPIQVEHNKATCIYNFYNLDPLWKKDITANRILLLEPSNFEKYPISHKSIDFMIALSSNISGIQIYVGEFNQLIREHNFGDIYYKEHPLNKHYQGIEEPRDWMFKIKGYYPSFFSFWKKCKKELTY